MLYVLIIHFWKRFHIQNVNVNTKRPLICYDVTYQRRLRWVWRVFTAILQNFYVIFTRVLAVRPEHK